MKEYQINDTRFTAAFDGRGAMTSLRFRDDPYDANFLLASAQEPWVPEEKQWGLGFLSLGHERVQITDCCGSTVTGNTASFTYRVSITDPRHCCTWPTGPSEEENVIRYDLVFMVSRKFTDDGLLETFVLINPSGHYIALDEIGLYASFHDTYVSEDHALERHVNQHFYTGGGLAWIEAPRQSGNPPHMGLISLSGDVASYQIEELNSSNHRGVIALISKEVRIAPGKTWELRRIIVPYQDRAEFEEIICRKTGFPVLDYGYMTIIEGNSFRFRIKNRGRFESASIGGLPMEDDGSFLTFAPPHAGEYEGRIRFAGGKIARIRLRVLEDPLSLLRRRADFIVRNQQVNDPADPRDGAFLCYDNMTEKIVRVEDIGDIYYSVPDRNDARERIGMGAFVAAFARVSGDLSYLPALRRYDAFLEKYIIDENFDVWDSYERQAGAKYYSPMLNTTSSGVPDMRYRTFNYIFVLAYETEMYWLTGEKHYAEICAGIIRRYIEKYGIGGNFCMLGLDMNAVRVLRDAGLAQEAEETLSYLKARVGNWLKIDDRYDPSEVVYEQGHAASAICEIAGLYLETRDEAFLPALERTAARATSFEGTPPDYRTYYTPVRHWDGFWFGGFELWGDTMPHYWSTISADAYCLYAAVTGDDAWRVRAEHIFRNNLALIEPDGSCSNSYIHPEKINGRPGARPDPLANDQDWAFYTYLRAEKAQEKGENG